MSEQVPRIEIHTLGWRYDHPAAEGEHPNVQINPENVIVYVDGVYLQGVVRAETVHAESEFARTVLTLVSPVRIITHHADAWRALCDVVNGKGTQA